MWLREVGVNHEGDIECTADAGVFGECACAHCQSAAKTARTMSDRDIEFAHQQREKIIRCRDQFSPMAIYQQTKGWKK
jgi:hypothetical protein